MKYTMSISRRIKDLRSFDFDKALEVLFLRNQGWTYDQIGDHLGLSHQRVMAIYKQVAGMTVEEAEIYRKVFDYLAKLPIAIGK
jgi:transcriptional regulator